MDIFQYLGNLTDKDLLSQAVVLTDGMIFGIKNEHLKKKAWTVRSYRSIPKNWIYLKEHPILIRKDNNLDGAVHGDKRS